MYKILIVEDDINISEMVTDYLSGEDMKFTSLYRRKCNLSIRTGVL